MPKTIPQNVLITLKSCSLKIWLFLWEIFHCSISSNFVFSVASNPGEESMYFYSIIKERANNEKRTRKYTRNTKLI